MMIFIRAGLASFASADIHSARQKATANASFRNRQSSFTGSQSPAEI
jgi:hypothetical protein